IITAFLVFINIIITIVDNNIYISEADKYLQDYMKTGGLNRNLFIYLEITLNILEYMKTRKISDFENSMRFLNILIVIVSEILIFLHYNAKLRILQIDKKLSEYDSLFSSGFIIQYSIEAIICCIFYPPYLNQVTTGRMLGLIYVYNYNSLI